MVQSEASSSMFDIEKNIPFALQVFNAYYRTPDASGLSYATFPDFFLVDPYSLDVDGLGIHSQEKSLLKDCKNQAIARHGYIGVSKYFDKKFGYHWIKLSPFPYQLGDAVEEKKSEFYYVLNQFIEFSKAHPDVYGDISAESQTDQDLALILRDVRKRGDVLREKTRHYAREMLVAVDDAWPKSELEKLLKTLESNDWDWNLILLEHLRHLLDQSSEIKPLYGAIAVPEMILLTPSSGIEKTNKLQQVEPAIDYIPLLEATSRMQRVAELATATAASNSNWTSEFMLPVEVTSKMQRVAESPATTTASHPTWPGDSLPLLTMPLERDAPPPVPDRLKREELERQLEQIKSRTAKLAQMNSDATQEMLEVEQERVRLEALMLVTTRKHIADAEAASMSSLERISATQKMRAVSESKSDSLERERTELEERTTQAILDREQAAILRKHEAEKRVAQEAELLAREQAQLEQERYLQEQITQRFAMVQQAEQAMHSQHQDGSAAVRLAEEKLAQILGELAQVKNLAAQEVEKNVAQEAELLVREQTQLEQARQQQEQIAQRLAVLEHAEQTMHAQHQDGNEAVRLAEEKLAQLVSEHAQAKILTAQEIEKRVAQEAELLAREHAQQEAERELQTQIEQRFAAVAQAEQTMHAQHQDGNEAVRLAEEKLAQLVSEHAQAQTFTAQEIEKRVAQEAELLAREHDQQEAERALQTQIEQRLAAVMQAEAATRERMQHEAEAAQLAEQQRVAEEAATVQAQQLIAQMKSAAHEHHVQVATALANDLPVHAKSVEHVVGNPFEYEEHLVTHDELNAEEFAHHDNLDAVPKARHLSRGVAYMLGAVMVMVGLWAWMQFGREETHAPPIKATQISPTVMPVVSAVAAASAVMGDTESYVLFRQMKMSDHLSEAR